MATNSHYAPCPRWTRRGRLQRRGGGSALTLMMMIFRRVRQLVTGPRNDFQRFYAARAIIHTSFWRKILYVFTMQRYALMRHFSFDNNNTLHEGTATI